MSAIDFMMGTHNHQPVGNFGHVFEETYERCYKPQLDVLNDHPGVRLALHYTGPLLEWIEKNRPEYIDMVAKMAERGQVEILSGGFYEPILSAIPEDDAVGQIVMMNDYIKKHFGVTPVGMWTAERIWDPALPKITAQAGIKFTLLDDTHFYYTGLESKDMFGYYMTEKHGSTLAVFPIDKNLRYTIPFREPNETIDYLKRIKDDLSAQGVTYGDDGEKFGSWPDTYKWVYEEKWLHNFYSALEENQDSIRTTHFCEYLDRHKPTGRIYIPMASYEEMMAWTLPAESGELFEKVIHTISDMGKKDEWKPFIRGGLWDNFLAKYDESNRIHKKMLYVSKKIAKAKKAPKKAIETAKRNLYQGQCNCAYWHGLFGGLYLNYLRHALYRCLIEAEKIVDNATHKTKTWVTAERIDFDMDGDDDVLLESRYINAYFDPDYGGSLFEFDYRPSAFSLSNTLTRRKEAYHHKIIEHTSDGAGGGAGEPASIHDIVKLKEQNLADWLQYDKTLRRSFQDHFLNDDVTLERFHRQEFNELGDFVDGTYEITELKKGRGKASVTLARRGLLHSGGGHHPVTIAKTFSMDGKTSQISAEYEVTNYGAERVECTMGVEFNLTLLAGDAEDRVWILEGSEQQPVLLDSGESKNVQTIGMRDGWAGFEVGLTLSAPMNIWHFPVETVSQSESGFERTYQGSCILVKRKISLAPSASIMFNITLSVKANG